MNWQITEKQLAAFPAQQKEILLFALARHLLTLPNPPSYWATCEILLTEQYALAQQYQITDLDNLKRFVEALHYVPDALQYTTVRDYLTSGGLPSARVELLLVWAKQQHKSQGANDAMQ